ncbi:MAG: oligosaccharide flippase family protein [Pseudomonadota bacterium]|nr:oligosaccharide flippase family protein [Pseudomonadota bacterium]
MAFKKLVKGASLLTTSQLLVALCTFFRNIIVARLISVEDYGIATIFALTVSLIEMSGNMAFDRILVQDKKGSSDDMLASAHLLQWSKSFVMALILFLLASPVANLFDLPELIWAFQMLAVIPFIKGFTHFDSVTQQRDLKFTATAYIDSIPQIVVIAAAYPLARWLGDYRVMLVIVIAQTAVSVLLSHVLATRPYRWTINKELIYKKLNFGWPLLINGLLMFAIFQGDKAIIGAQYSMEILGWYGAAFALTMMPTLLFAKVSGFLLLPVLSKSRDDETRFISVGMLSIVFCTSVAVFCAIFFTIGGAAFINLSYGEKYLAGGTVIAILGLMQGMRIIRIAPTVMATSQADTKNPMYSNIVRTVALILALIFAYYKLSVEWIALSGLIGEVFALIAALYLLKLPSSKSKYINCMLIQLFVSSAICAFVYFVVPAPDLSSLSSTLIRLVEAVLASLVLGVFVAMVDNTTRQFVIQQYRRLLNRAS